MGEFEKRVLKETEFLRGRLDRMEAAVKKHKSGKPQDEEEPPKPRKGKPTEEPEPEETEEPEPEETEEEPEEDEGWPF